MKRRGAIKVMTVVAGTSILLPTFNSCRSDQYSPLFFSKKDWKLLDEISEVILPKTLDAPGAKDCQVTNFVDLYINDCYSLEHQNIIQAGFMAFNETCQLQHRKSFLRCSSAEKKEFLIDLDRTSKASDNPHYFTLLKSTIIFAYFTSKDGIESALDYLPIPGKYIGDYPMTTEQKVWAL